MLSTKEIIRGMREEHFIEVRLIVQNGSLHKELIPILDKYRSGEYTEEEVRECTHFTLNKYKHLERRLYNILVNYYKITPNLEQDTVISQAFHGLYSSEENDNKNNVAYLEKVFNKMQSLQLAEEGLEVIRQLVIYKRNTELHAVYHHLYGHYLNRHFSNQRSLILINQLFNRMNNFNNKNKKEEIRQLIFIYKQLRSFSIETDNPLSKVAYRISQLTMVINYDQNQLLYQEKITLQKSIVKCERELSKLPGNFERFYMDNILLLLKLKWAAKTKNLILFAEIEKIIARNPKILEAHNFNFSIQNEGIEFNYLRKIVEPLKNVKKLSISAGNQWAFSNINLPQMLYKEDGKSALYN